jgi:hypothetical protein
LFASACQPPELALIRAGEHHPASADPEPLIKIHEPLAPYAFTASIGLRTSSDISRTGYLTIEGTAALDAAITSLEESWTGRYPEDCNIDCFHESYADFFEDGEGRISTAFYWSYPAEFLELDRFITDVMDEVIGCDPPRLTEPTPECLARGAAPAGD